MTGADDKVLRLIGWVQNERKRVRVAIVEINHAPALELRAYRELGDGTLEAGKRFFLRGEEVAQLAPLIAQAAEDWAEAVAP